MDIVHSTNQGQILLFKVCRPHHSHPQEPETLRLEDKFFLLQFLVKITYMYFHSRLPVWFSVDIVEHHPCNYLQRQKILTNFQVAHAPVRTHTLTTEEQRLAVREHIFPHNLMFSPFKCIALHFNLTPTLALRKTSMITLTLT